MNRREFLRLLLLTTSRAKMSHSLLTQIALNMDNKDLIVPPKGLFCVTNTANWVVVNGIRVNLFDYDIDCVCNYARWADIEKMPGKYEWKGLDRMLQEAKKAKKMLAYHIMAGIHTPEWVYKRFGVKAFTYTSKYKQKHRVITFLPWVENHGKYTLNFTMLDLWKNIINAFAKKLRSHPDYSRIAYIAITGGPTSNGIEVMFQQDFYNDFKRLNWTPSKEELFIDYWKHLVDIFLESFPDKPLGLAFTDFFGVDPFNRPRRNYNIPKKVIDYAISKAMAQNSLVIPMGLWIGGFKPAQLSKHRLLKMITSYKMFAFQGPVKSPSYEWLAAMLSFMQSFKPCWVELWHNDIINPKFRPLIKKFRDFLNS